MYTVRLWTNDRKLATCKTLTQAKRVCRSYGHDGTASSGKYAPHCWVADAGDWLVYNPVFRVGKDDHLKREEPSPK